METSLDLIDIPTDILHGSCICLDDCHKFSLELYFLKILEAINTADSVLPRSSFKYQKPYWNSELNALKIVSIATHRSWLNQGKPLEGPF